MKTFLNRIFPEKNENYRIARDGLKNMKKQFDGFVVSFPDVTPHEIMLIKEQWEELPKKISSGVELMAVKATKQYKSLVAHYKTDSYIMPHRHPDLHEFGIIMKGEIKDKLTGEIYKRGDRYYFEPNQPHYLNTNGKECIVYTVLTENANHKMKPLPLKLIKNLNII